MRVWSLIASVLIGGIASTAVLAQAPTAASGSRAIGVVDIGHILQNHPTMKKQMEAIKASMEAADKEMTAKRDQIVTNMEKIRETLVEGTDAYDAAEKSLAEQDTAFRLELVKKRKDFEQQQADVLFKVYSEINFYLSHLNQQAGVQVVLRVNREKMDPKKPETVQMVMSQDVLYFNSDVDYTDWVLSGMTQSAKKTANAGTAVQK